eukprot:3184767-Pyramimonas_sp.AAC.1
MVPCSRPLDTRTSSVGEDGELRRRVREAKVCMSTAFAAEADLAQLFLVQCALQVNENRCFRDLDLLLDSERLRGHIAPLRCQTTQRRLDAFKGLVSTARIVEYTLVEEHSLYPTR